MAKIDEINEEAWEEWISQKPESVQKLCRSHPVGRLYKLIQTGQRGAIHSYNEHGTLTLGVMAEYNELPINFEVFGISPDDLIECDLPSEEELVGELLTPAQVQEFKRLSDQRMKLVREMIDLGVPPESFLP